MPSGVDDADLYVLQRIAAARPTDEVALRHSIYETVEHAVVVDAHRCADRPLTARSLLDAALQRLYDEVRTTILRLTLADVLELSERLEVLMVRHELLQVDGLLAPPAMAEVLGPQGQWSTALRWLVEVGRAQISRTRALSAPVIRDRTLDETSLHRLWALAVVAVELATLAEIAAYEFGDRFLTLGTDPTRPWPEPNAEFVHVQREWFTFTATRATTNDDETGPTVEQDLLLSDWRARHAPIALVAGALAALGDELLLRHGAVIVDLPEDAVVGWLARNRHVRPPDARRLLRRLLLRREDGTGLRRWLSGAEPIPARQDAPHRHRRSGSLLDRPIFAYDDLSERRLVYGSFTLLRSVERIAEHELRDRRRDAVRGTPQIRARRKEDELRHRLGRDPRVARVIGGKGETRSFIEDELGLTFDQNRDGDYDALALLPSLRIVLLVELKSRQTLATSIQDQLTQYAKATREQAVARLERRAAFLRRHQALVARCMPGVPAGAMVRVHQRLVVSNVSAGECFALGVAAAELEPLPELDLVDWLLARQSR